MQDKPRMARNIKRLRKERHWRQEDLAGQLGVSRALVSLWEIGSSRPQADEIETMADLFGVSTDFLLGRTDVRYPAQPPSPACDAARYNPALPPVLEAMFLQHRLYSHTQIALFTNGALTVEEISRLRAGESPAALPEERLVRFLRKFNLDCIRQYFTAARLPLPQEFRDIEAEIRELADRVYLSSDGSPDALEYVIRTFQEEFEGRKPPELSPEE